jgi:hypothetical protein
MLTLLLLSLYTTNAFARLYQFPVGVIECSVSTVVPRFVLHCGLLLTVCFAYWLVVKLSACRHAIR